MAVAKERPHFGPDQIRSSREIKLGDKVIPVHFTNVEDQPIEIVGYFAEEIGRGFIIRNSYGRLDTIYYADKGLVPYQNRWNQTNWLKRIN